MKADTAGGGEEAIQMVAAHGLEKRYDLVFMDHMMPEVDGIEASRRIRAGEEEQRKKAEGVPKETAREPLLGVPNIALSANAVSGARELFLGAGMNDFISKPIEAHALNIVLSKWLPAEKIIITVTVIESPAGGYAAGAAETISVPAAEGKSETVSAELPAAQRVDDPLRTNLSAIPGLNTEDGLSHNGGSWERYCQTLQQFCSGFDEDMRAIAESVEKEDWGDYVIRFHAYKEALAGMGHKALSEWAAGLEAAGKAADASPTADATEASEAAVAAEAAGAIALCKGITPSVHKAMRAFRAAS